MNPYFSQVLFQHFQKKEKTLAIHALLTSVKTVPYVDALHRNMWDAFVATSMNGTVFHSQQFLDYHPADRFDFHHLLFFENDRLVALLPGGLRDNGSVYDSPLGASYGSFVVGDVSADTALSIVRSFESYITDLGVQEVFLTQAPVIYQQKLTQNLEFALLYGGYSYQRHYISHAIDLRTDALPFNRFQPTARKHIRRTLHNFSDIVIEEVSKEGMAKGIVEFFPILLENKAKYNAKPTHTLDELLRLHSLLPDMMKLFLIRKEGKAIAGSLLFLANSRVALIFYHMLLYEYDSIKPIYLLMDRVTQWSQQNGYAFVDIGVSQDTSDDNPMTPALSLIRFKEKFDSRGLLRSTLRKQYSS